MALSASISIGISVPVADGLGDGWRNALSMWMILAALSIVLWLIQMPQLNQASAPAQPEPDRQSAGKARSVYRSRLAWQFAAYFGLQSLLFYSLSAWIPSILQSRGYTVEEAATIAFILQLFNLPSTFLVPILCARCRDQRLPVLVFCSLFFTGTVLFLFAGKATLTYVSILIAALGMGSGLGFGNVFISLRTRTAQEAAALSGMGQSMGYLLAATGPVLLGFLFDQTGSWMLPLLFSVVCILLMGFFGLKTARDRYLFPD
jgi:CP family cyanate transporter-like MFS transporter